MMVFDEEITVANAAAGTDLLDGWEDSQVGYNRYIVATGLVGGNAVGEPVVAVKVSGKEVERSRGQLNASLALTPALMLASRTKVPAGTKIQAVVLTAPTVSPIRFRIVCVP